MQELKEAKYEWQESSKSLSSNAICNQCYEKDDDDCYTDIN